MNTAKTVIYVILAAVVIYIVLSLFHPKDYRVGEPAMRGKYEQLIAYNALREDWRKLNCTVNISDSLAQSLHIVKEGSSLSCVEDMNGELYNNLRKPFSCNAQDAGSIDDAVRKNGSCVFPLNMPLNEDVRDYHALVLLCVVNLTNWNYTGRGPCNVGYPQSVIYAVVDSNGNVYY
jgi:hypothetical protein